MAESKDFAAEAGTAKVVGTVSSTDIAAPVAPPLGMRAVGPRITFHFVGEWDAETSYVLYDVVRVNGTSYIANKINIAKGVNPETDNDVHWVKWNDPNSQVAVLQQTVNGFDARITEAEMEAVNAAGDAAEAKKASADNAAAIKKASADNAAAINAETARAKAAEGANSSAIAHADKQLAATENSKLLEMINDVSVFATPEKYGAIGDGVTDDTTAFKNALAANDVIVLTKKYKITDVSVSGKKIINAGYDDSYETPTANIVTDSIAFSSVTDSNLIGICISGASKKGIGIQSANNSKLYACTFNDLNKGIEKLLATTTIDTCHFTKCNYAIESPIDSKIVNSTFNVNTTAIYLSAGANDNVISNCKIEWNDNGILSYQSANNVISNNVFDRNAKYAVYCNDSATHIVTSNMFKRNGIETGSNNTQLISNSPGIIANNIFAKANSLDDGSGAIVPEIAMSVSNSNCLCIGNDVSNGYTVTPIQWSTEINGALNIGADPFRFGIIKTKTGNVSQSKSITIESLPIMPSMMVLHVYEYQAGGLPLGYTVYVNAVAENYITLSGVPAESKLQFSQTFANKILTIKITGKDARDVSVLVKADI